MEFGVIIGVLFVLGVFIAMIHGSLGGWEAGKQQCPHCKKWIAKSATRCSFCTSELLEQVVDAEAVNEPAPKREQHLSFKYWLPSKFWQPVFIALGVLFGFPFFIMFFLYVLDL